MTFIKFAGFQPGMRITESRINSGDLVGRLVFRATRDATQSISSTSLANPDIANALAWETIAIDDLGGWSSGSATRYTCMLDGWYRISAKVSLDATATPGDARSLGIYQNGALAAAGHFRSALAVTNRVHTEHGFLTLSLVAGDYVQIVPGHSTGSALTSATGGARPAVEITFARPA